MLTVLAVAAIVFPGSVQVAKRCSRSSSGARLSVFSRKATLRLWRVAARLPTGTVTFLIADIEGSTRHVQDTGAEYAAILATVRRILRSVVGANDGVEVDATGDELCAVFADALAAITSALEAQRILQQELWPGEARVRVRIGLHTGAPALGDEGYLGLDVIRAARVSGAGHGGQILLSSPTAELAAGHELRDLGSHQLSGLPAPEQIFQLLADGLPRDFPPLRNTIGQLGAGCRVVVADDSLLLREGVVRLLEEVGFEIVGQSGTAPDLLRHVAMHSPDVAIVDIRMPPTHTDEGLRAAAEIRAAIPGHRRARPLAVRRGGLRRSSFSPEAPRVSATSSRIASPISSEFGAAVRRVADGGSALDPDGRQRAARPEAPARPARRDLAARARGPRADGRGPLEPGDRRSDVRDPARGREARDEHLHEARPAGQRRRSPSGAGRAHVPAVVGAAPRSRQATAGAESHRQRERCGYPHPETPDRRTVPASARCEPRGHPKRSRKETPHVTPEAQHEHRGPDGSLERPPPEDRDLRLACVRHRLVRDRHRDVGMKTIDENDFNVGEARKADHIIRDAGFKLDEQMEYVLVQSKTQTATDPAFRAVVDDAIATLDGFRAGREAPLAARGGQRGPDLGGRPLGADPVQPQGHVRRDASPTSTRSSPVPRRCRRPTPTSSWSRPARRRPARRSTRCSAPSSPGPGSISIPLTLVILLLVFGSLVGASIPLGARPHRRLRDDGPRRPAEPDRADGRVGRRGHPADRPRRRRRLLAVLHPPRTRRASRRTQRVGRARGRSRDVRPGRAHLRLHGDDRDGRHVLLRRQDVHVVRDRHDDGRRASR